MSNLRVLRILRVLSISFVGALLILLVASGAASAHERRPIAGKYDVVVGFDREPAFVGQQNAASIRVFRAGTQDPVAGVEKTLKLRLAFGGGAAKELPLRAVFGQEGYYVVDFFPTRAGSYVFTFVGQIDGTPVEERFESGPGRFNDVQDAAALQFPGQVPDPAAMFEQVKAVQAEAAQARTIGIAGALIGLLGLVVGGIGLVFRRPGVATPTLSREAQRAAGRD